MWQAIVTESRQSGKCFSLNNRWACAMRKILLARIPARNTPTTTPSYIGTRSISTTNKEYHATYFSGVYCVFSLIIKIIVFLIILAILAMLQSALKVRVSSMHNTASAPDITVQH
jgi:hypothetical protein